MIFQHTIDQVLDGTKTMTSRHVKAGDRIEGTPDAVTAVYRNGRVLYELGQLVAVQPGRGKRSRGRARVTSIVQRFVRDTPPADAKRERPDQAKPAAAFRKLWDEMYGPGSFDRDEVYAIGLELVK